MRRPLDWIVVSIALLVLFVDRWQFGADTTAETPPREESRRAAVQAIEEMSPFAYIREDGSEVYLPVSGSAPRPAIRAQKSSATNAVLTWSVQPAPIARDFPLLQ